MSEGVREYGGMEEEASSSSPAPGQNHPHSHTSILPYFSSSSRRSLHMAAKLIPHRRQQLFSECVLLP